MSEIIGIDVDTCCCPIEICCCWQIGVEENADRLALVDLTRGGGDAEDRRWVGCDWWCC